MCEKFIRHRFSGQIVLNDDNNEAKDLVINATTTPKETKTTTMPANATQNTPTRGDLLE